MRTETTPIKDGLSSEKLHFVDIDGVKLRYYEDGAGEPLVLLSGGEYGSLYSLDAWSLNLSELAKNFHVYAFDKPGQGFSTIPQRDADYTWEWLFDHIRKALNALGISGAHFVGHSRGSLIVARIALDYPQMIKTAVMVDSSTTAPEDPHMPTDLLYQYIGRWTPPGAPTRESVRLEADAQSVSTDHITGDFVDRMLKVASLPSIQEAQKRMNAGVRMKVWYPSLYAARAKTVREIEDRGLGVPTLIMWGFNDRGAPLYLGHRLFERVCPLTPDAEFLVLNRTGHYVFREQCRKFNRTLKSFCLDR
jgi:2-hydroxy-6-oxonona-2,4-dienedioate hydrolase